MTKAEINKLVRNVRVVTRYVETRWHRNQVPLGVYGAASRCRTTVDVEALCVVVAFVLQAEGWRGGGRALEAAIQLDEAVATIKVHRREIAAALAA